MSKSVLVLAVLVALAALPAADHTWQLPHAEVKPNGDLALQQRPFVFEAGETVRYIDFEAGDDSAVGNRQAPWKHHPWDPAASGKAKAQRGPATYVFKGGVIYRGEFRPGDDRGTPEEPIRLSRDPSWGEGPALIYGSERLTGGWQRGGHARMPESDTVWHLDLDWRPRTAWVVDAEQVTRLKLARDPNWTESDPDDLMSEWYTWQQPQWWENDNNRTRVGDRMLHLGIDSEILTGSAEDYVDGTVWSEWGFVMGSPYPSKIHSYDAQKQAITFHGPWTNEGMEHVVENNRYFLEDRPQWLDEGGEFWFEPRGTDGGRLYARMPGDADPNALVIEVGKRSELLDARQLHHVHLSGLTFRFTNQSWDYNMPQWWGQDNATGIGPNKAAVIRIIGAGDDIVIAHCRFEHVHMAARIRPTGGQALGTVRVVDNAIHETDHGAVRIDNDVGGDPEREGGDLAHVDFLRNDLYRVGMRGLPADHGHGVSIARPTTAHVAGNMLHRIGGWGISVTGGKGGGQFSDEPYGRYLIHHNRIEDPLLLSNDWGGIETWQGGSHYVWSNVSINPGGFRYWGWNDRGDSAPRFGHAYYMDGAFKNFYFNNIAVGKSNDKREKTAAEAAFQEIHGFQNSIFNNTAYKFVNATRRQAPGAGRNKYLGNVFSDISEWVFYHATPPEGGFDPNAHHFDQSQSFNHATGAYANNVLHAVRKHLGVFESHGKPYDDLEAASAALASHGSQQPSIGVIAERQPLRDPENGDFRPRSGGPAEGRGVRTFVPWQLGRTVGEWHFTRNHQDPSRVIDEAWYMQAYFHDRERYQDTPRYPLIGTGIAADDFVAGQLENWTDGALRLDGEQQALRVAHDQLVAPFQIMLGDTPRRWEGAQKATVDIHASDLLIEAYLQTSDADGVIAAKGTATGYRLEVVDGALRLRLRADGADALSLDGPRIADGKWHHVIAELDRQTGRATIHLDGSAAATSTSTSLPASFANEEDFEVGTGLAMTIDFLRVCRSTLAASGTDIAELHAWQFDGPQYRDFAGQPRGDEPTAGALE